MTGSLKTVLILLFFFVLCLTVFYPFLFGDKFFAASDATAYEYPAFEFLGHALKEGESFLWNPLLFSGFPTYASQTGGFFDPVNWVLLSLFTPLSTYIVRILIGVFLTLSFSYFVGRAHGLSHLSSAVIGMSYLLVFHWGQISNSIVANTVFLVPFLIFIFTQIFDGDMLARRGWKKWLWAACGGLGMGWALIGGNAQFVIYGLFLSGLYLLIRVLTQYGLRIELKTAITIFFLLFFIVSVGVLVALPQIIPSFKFIPFTFRADGLDYASAATKSITSGDFLLFLFPDYLYFPYLSGGRMPLYIGAFWFFSALIGISLMRKRKEVMPIFLTFLFALLVSIKGSPIFYLMQQLPVFAYFRNPSKWMFMGSFFLAMMGAFGFEYAKEQIGNKMLRRVFIIIGAGVGVIAAGIVFLNIFGDRFLNTTASSFHAVFSKILYGNFGFTKDPLHYKEAVARGVSAWREFTSFGDPSFLFPFLLLIFSLLLVLLFLWERISWRQFRGVGFFVSVFTFVGVMGFQFSHNLPLRPLLSSQKALRDKLFQNNDDVLYRAYVFMLEKGFRDIVPPKFKFTRDEELAFSELSFESLWPNVNFFSRIPLVGGYDQLVPRDYLLALDTIGSTDSIVSIARRGEPDPSERLQRFLIHQDVWGMMAGKYVISGVALESNDLRLLGTHVVSRYKIPLYLYENKKALPRFYVAKKVVSAPGVSLVDLIKNGRGNFQEVTYLDCSGCEAGGGKTADLEVVSARNGDIELRVKASSPRWLVVSESNLPGWSASIDGNDAKIVGANGLYMAVLVPAGDHDVTFSYQGMIGEAKWLRHLGL